MDEISKKEAVELLIKFIKICAEGSVKPYDHSHFLSKVGRQQGDMAKLLECCPPFAEVRDAKDFRSHMQAAMTKVAEILDFKDLIIERNDYR